MIDGRVVMVSCCQYGTSEHAHTATLFGVWSTIHDAITRHVHRANARATVEEGDQTAGTVGHLDLRTPYGYSLSA